MSQEKLLLQEKISRLVWRLAIPTIISMVVTALYNIVDRMFIGHIPGIGSFAMTGLGLSAPAVIISFALVMLIGIGASTLISLRLGAKKTAEAQHLFSVATTMVIASQLLIMILTWWFLSPLLKMLGADETTLPYARDYLRIIAGGYLFLGLTFLGAGVLRAAGYAATATIANVVGTLTNIVLDGVFIFVFGWGIAGAAWATIISQGLGLLIVIGFFFFKKSQLPLRLPAGRPAFSGQVFKQTAKIGFSPAAMQLLSSVVIILANNILLEHGGNQAVAAMTIIFSLMTLTNLPLIGFIQGIQPIIGFNYGAGAFARVRQTIIYSAKVLLVIGLVNTFFIFFMTRPLINIFSSDAQVVASASSGIKIFLGLIILVGWQILCSSYFQFIGKAKPAAFLTLLRQVILLIPLLLFLPRFFGVNGVWLAWPVTDVLAFIVGLWVFRRDFGRLPQTDQPPRGDLTKMARAEIAAAASSELKGIAEIETI
jgi:putative MATE family efflux protein